MTTVKATTSPVGSGAVLVAQNSHFHMGLEQQQQEEYGKAVEEEEVAEEKERREGEGRERRGGGKTKLLTKFGNRLTTSE